MRNVSRAAIIVGLIGQLSHCGLMWAETILPSSIGHSSVLIAPQVITLFVAFCYAVVAPIFKRDPLSLFAVTIHLMNGGTAVAELVRASFATGVVWEAFALTVLLIASAVTLIEIWEAFHKQRT